MSEIDVLYKALDIADSDIENKREDYKCNPCEDNRRALKFALEWKDTLIDRIDYIAR